MRQADKTLDRNFVLETIVMHLPSENYQETFERNVRWSRFAELFTYEEVREQLRAL